MVVPTPAQVAIRDAEELGLLVVAPAGCGKTEAMALRVSGLISRGQVPSGRRVLVTTFSNRSRDNIKERLHVYLKPAALRDRVTVANFHGLAARIFRAHANVIGMDPALLIPESDWVGEQLRSRNVGYRGSASVQALLQRTKQQALDDAAVEQAIIDAGDVIALDLERQRRAEGRLTYDDLPRLAELILREEIVADLYRQHFSSIVVDEFQDLTLQQLRIVNRIGLGRTTYAGDLAQGIYGFAGAAPDEVHRLIQAECARRIEFSESHRSSPAVLAMVNALATRTGGSPLSSADPSAWPQGGLAARGSFATTSAEADWAMRFARFVLQRAPEHRIGIIARTGPRRRFADAVFEAADLPVHRWDDPILDTEVARIVSSTLARFDDAAGSKAEDLVEYMRELAGADNVQDPSTREGLVDALGWSCDLLREGLSAKEIRGRVRVGDGTTLLRAPGVHLLTGHVGKGQQFDWVVVLGAEDGCIPDFRATTAAAVAEEARVLSVMLSRARHGAVVLRSDVVQASTGRVMSRAPSPFLADFDNLPECLDLSSAVEWLKNVSWESITAN